MAHSRRMGVRNVGAKRLPRHLRNEDLPTDTFTPRTYQVELLDSALKRNTVVCMGSSTGRTFIAVMLIKEMAEDVRKSLSEGGKRSVYLVDNDSIISQQSQVIQHPSDLTVGSYSLNSEINKWSAEQWKKEIESSQVLVMAASTFHNLLHQDFLSLSAVNLLILDECHLVLQDHPYKEIMALYRSLNQNETPRILGLTSSILKEKYSSSPESLGNLITSLEEALCSTAETSTLVIPERYGVRPAEQIIECPDYEDTTGLNEQFAEILESAIDFLDECNIEVTQDLDNRDPTQIPKAALIECHNIMTQLGPWCAACLADMLIAQIEKIEKQKEFVPMHKKFLKFGATTLRMISKIFEDHFKHADYSLEELLSYSTPKVAKMLDCFNKYRPDTDFVIISEEIDDNKSGSDTEMSDDDDSDFSLSGDEEDNDRNKSPSGGKQIHVAVKKVSPENDKPFDPFSTEEEKFLSGIIFVEYQHEAYALNKFIEEVCAWEERLCFIKSSHITGQRSAGKKETKLFKKQEETLRKFRMQELNLLVSTSVLEEGVDVPKCNLVIRFDIPKDYRSYSQSKGRARAREAEFVILIEEENFDEFESQLKVYRNIEQVLIGRYKEPEEVSANETQDENSEELLPPYIPTDVEGGPQVTMSTAITLVNRYCAKLPSDAFTHLTPSCRITEITAKEETQYVASLRLPINSPIKQLIEGKAMSTRLKAKQAVALKMCEILHKSGELDNSLMPVGKEMFQHEEDDIEWEEEEDILGEARPGTTKRKQYYAKKIASALLLSHPVPDITCNLYLFNMKLTGAITDEQNTRGRRIFAPEDSPRGFGLLTSKNIPLVPLFPVYTRSGEVSVSVDILKSDLLFTEAQLDRLKLFHKYLFANVLRLEKDPMDYIPEEAVVGYLVVPVYRQDDEQQVIDWAFIDKVEEANIAEKNDKPAKTEEEMFVFNNEEYEDAVVMPSYRNIDQPQHFYVAEIRYDLNPLSSFPSPELYKTFCAYYTTKYGLSITNMDQPLLDVDHTSARLNLLIPRYMNQKGVALPTSSAETKKARRENLQQKQILVPELCDVHVFPASLWRKAVCLPAILYRMNYLLLAEEIRKHIASETNIGIVELPEDFRFPQLDFGFDTSPENLKSSNEESENELPENKTKTCSGSTEKDKNLEGNDIVSEKEMDDDIMGEKGNEVPSCSNSSEIKHLAGICENVEELEGNSSNKKQMQVANTADESSSKLVSSKDSEKNKIKNHIEISDNNIDCKQGVLKNKMSQKVGTEYIPESGANLVKDKDSNQVHGKLIHNPGEVSCESNSVNQHIKSETDQGQTVCDKIHASAINKPINSTINSTAFLNKEYEANDSNNSACNRDTYAACHCKDCTVNIIIEGKSTVLKKNAKSANAGEQCPSSAKSSGLVNGVAEECEGNSVYENKTANKNRLNKTAEATADVDLKSRAENDVLPEVDDDQEASDRKGPTTSEILVNDLASDLKGLDIDLTVLNQESGCSSWGEIDAAADQEIDIGCWNSNNHVTDLHEHSVVNELNRNVSEESHKNFHEKENVAKEISKLEKKVAVEKENKSEENQKTLHKENTMADDIKTNTSRDTNSVDVEEKKNCQHLKVKSDTANTGENSCQDSKEDIFEKVSYFKDPDRKDSDSETEDLNEFPEPLISLDEDIDLTTYIGPTPCFILQAFTMSNANDFFSLERLETIGDSFLKYAITVYLYCSYPGIHEGKLSYLRSKQVSNYNLYRLGKRKGLAECMISTKFEPYENWLPPGFIVNEDKRKGPVPKVLIAQKVYNRTSSAIFTANSDEKEALHTNDVDANHSPAHISEMEKFNEELEAAAQISQAEELEQGDKSDNQNVLTPYSLQVHHSIPDKSIADCVEALIGCYLTSCGKMAALRFMSWMGLKVLPRKEVDVSSNMEFEVQFEKLPCPQSPLLSTHENAQNILLHQLDGYEKFEERIGYTFRDRSYLLQAFTHASYHYNTVTDCYQRLEFLGDAILDYVITRHLYEDSDKYSPGVLTDLRSALVNNNIFAALAVKWDFHKYFKAISPVLFNVIEKFVARQKEKEDEIDLEDEEADEDQDKERVELEVPKALGDIFESVAGAIYLDSGMSLDVVWGVFYRIMKPQIDKYLKSIPKSPVRELLEQEPETAKFEKPERTMDGKIRVTVNVVGKGVFSGVGRNYRIAKSAAAKKALRCIKTLEQQGLI